MTRVRIATFNVENLFARFRFNAGIDPSEANSRGWTVDQTAFHELSVDEKALTGMAIRELDADVLCLQEVENVDTLKHFRAQFLGGRRAYPYVAGVDGNDPRLIDVAVLSRLPVTRVRSHQHLLDPAQPTATLFSRDCLEVDIATDAGPLSLFMQHFKSMIGGRTETRPKRLRQAEAVRRIITDRFGEGAGDVPLAVLGDLNDYPQSDEDGETSLGVLLQWDQLEDVLERLADEDRWTHYWARGREYRQLDYVLVSRALAERSPAPPEVMRKGLPLRADRYGGERFIGVGEDHPKASDHCPVALDLDL